MARHLNYHDAAVLAVTALAGLFMVAILWFCFRGLLGDIGEWLTNLVSTTMAKMSRGTNARQTQIPLVAGLMHTPSASGERFLHADVEAGFGGTDTTLEQQDVLPVLPRLLNTLTHAGVRQGVCKNSATISRAASGQEDLNIILARNDLRQFHRAMDEMRAVRGYCSRLNDNAVPGREDWFVPDEDGRFLHLDVAFGLMIGRKFNKRYRALEFEDIAGWRHQPFAAETLRVVSPFEEARIATLRSVFSLRTWPGRKWVPADRATQVLFGAMQQGCQPTAFEYRIGSQAVQCPVRLRDGSLELAGSGVRRLRQVIRAENGLAWLPGRFRDAIDSIVNGARRTAFAIACRLTCLSPGKSVARRTLKPNGVVVALIGPDGVGKSTQAGRLATTFQGRFRCTAVYMGSNDGAWMAFRARLKRRLSLRRRLVEQDSEPGVIGPRDPSAWNALGRACWRLIIAIQRRMAMRKCIRLAKSGALVISDRWPQYLVRGYLDGPSLPPPNRMKLAHLLWRIECSIHRGTAAVRPTLTIQLDCDFATSYARKPGDILEEDFERRLALMQEMRRLDPDVKVVDAREDMASVARNLTRWVWFAMWSHTR